MKVLTSLLRQQSTHSAIILAVILVLVAQLAGVDLVALTNEAKEFLVAAAGLSLAAKAILPDPKPPAPPISEAAVKGLERLNNAMEDKA